MAAKSEVKVIKRDRTMNQDSPIVKLFKNPTGALRRGRNELKDSIGEMVQILSPRPALSEIINQKEIRIVGLKRTGNHAITNWIKKQQTGSVRYLNNVPCDKNPYRHFYERHLSYNNHPQTIRQFKRESQGKLRKYDCLIYSYEDYSLEEVTNPEFAEKHDRYLGKSGERYDVLILRDPFNLLASRLKNDYLEVKSPHKTVIDLWIAYAKEYLGETQYLNNNKVCVDYNRWTIDREYRASIAAALKLEFSDAGINEVKGQGGGSSFEGQAFDGQASKMDVHNRWKHYAEDPLYRQLLDNRELLEYSERIFGHIPGTESLGLA